MFGPSKKRWLFTTQVIRRNKKKQEAHHTFAFPATAVQLFCFQKFIQQFWNQLTCFCWPLQAKLPKEWKNEIMAQIFALILLSSFVARFLGNKKTVSTRCNLLRAHQGPLKNHKNNRRFFSLEHEKNHTKRSQKLYKTSCSAGLSDVTPIFQPLFMVLSGMGIIFEHPPSQELSRRFRKPGHTAPLSTSSTTGTQQLRKLERLGCWLPLTRHELLGVFFPVEVVDFSWEKYPGAEQHEKGLQKTINNRTKSLNMTKKACDFFRLR